MLDSVEVETGREPTGSVIFLHGLGADGYDFEPIVRELVDPGERGLRFVLPHAPQRPITLNAGLPMRAWYDIITLDRGAREDENGIRESCGAVRELIGRENQRGIAAERIVLAGFSQGGALALCAGTRCPERLAGIAGLSCFMPLAARFGAERSAANQGTPVFLAHGTEDPIVDVRRGEQARDLLRGAGYDLEWHAYPIPHAVCPEEIADLARWLRRVL